MAGSLSIVSIEEVKQRLSLPNDVDEVDEALSSGLTAAEAFFAAELGTEFCPNKDIQEVFHLDPVAFHHRPSNLYRLRLNQAFVKRNIVPVLLAAGTRRDLASGAVTVAATDYQVDYEKGIIFVEDVLSNGPGISFRDIPEATVGMFVSVTYSAGLDSTNKAPVWLKEAVLAWIPSILIQPRSDKPEVAMKLALQIRDNARAMVERHKREASFNVHPII